jgi:flavin-dependent dehydrogenase
MMGPARESGDVYDCVVVGAGPAGSVTARELARAGRSVLLVDAAHFPRSKVCGCCLSPRAVRALDAIGLEAPLGGVRLDALELAAKGRRAVVSHPLGKALSREALDLALIDAAIAAGVEFSPGTHAAIARADQTPWRALTLLAGGRKRTVRARTVVAAHGLASTFRGPAERVAPGSRIGAGAVAQRVPPGYVPGRIYMACGRDGYVGAVVVEGARLDLAAALRPEAIRPAGGIGAICAEILESAGLPGIPGISALAWRGTPALTRQRSEIAGARVFYVGDAAGYVEPFTGEGMASAIVGAIALAEILGAPGRLDDVTARESAWRGIHRRQVRHRQTACVLLSKALRRHWLARAIVASLRVAPPLARPVLWQLHGA